MALSDRASALYLEGDLGGRPPGLPGHILAVEASLVSLSA